MRIKRAVYGSDNHSNYRKGNCTELRISGKTYSRPIALRVVALTNKSAEEVEVRVDVMKGKKDTRS